RGTARAPRPRPLPGRRAAAAGGSYTARTYRLEIMTLGLDLSDGIARAVVVNEQGQVLSRGEQALDPASPGAAANQAARRAIAGAGAAVSRVGVALPRPGDEMPSDVATALSGLLPGAPEPRAVSAGVAAVVAEQWCGAARDLRHVIGFSV